MVASTRKLMISNGEEFFEISAADLEAARQDGFYLPSEHGCTLVTDGSDIFEIPLEDLAEAESDGYRSLASPAQAKVSPANPGSRRRLPAAKGRLSVAAVRIDTGADAETIDATSVILQAHQSQPESVDLSEVAIETNEPNGDVETDAPEAIAVEEVVDEDAEYRAALEEQLEEAEGMDRLKLLLALHAPTPEEVNKFSRTYGLSTLLHIVALIILSLIVYQSAEKADGGAVISSKISADEELDPEDEEPEVEIAEITEVTETVNETADLAGEIQNTVGLPTSDLVSALSASDLGGGLEGVGEAAGKAIKASASFFGSKTVASRFVFVIDNSNSMTKGRFETALNELAKTLETLKKDQYYYIIFYSDTAYGLFHPRTVSDLIPATKQNKLLTLRWLLTVQLCLRTDAAYALESALRLDPDVIFMLGDGAFTDVQDVRKVMAARSEDQKKIKINALGMEVNAGAAKNFTNLAKATGGTYNDVGVHPVGAEIAKRTPRPKNNKRGPIWGITLPAK